tara:strand:- start:333 stop:536 length:204 start_codon:yes stop_codon:yes gene_type:complete
MDKATERAIALRNASTKAKDPEFKKMWEMKLIELIGRVERGLPTSRAYGKFNKLVYKLLRRKSNGST